MQPFFKRLAVNLCLGYCPLPVFRDGRSRTMETEGNRRAARIKQPVCKYCFRVAIRRAFCRGCFRRFTFIFIFFLPPHSLQTHPHTLSTSIPFIVPVRDSDSAPGWSFQSPEYAPSNSQNAKSKSLRYFVRLLPYNIYIYIIYYTYSITYNFVLFL